MKKTTLLNRVLPLGLILGLGLYFPIASSWSKAEPVVEEKEVVVVKQPEEAPQTVTDDIDRLVTDLMDRHKVPGVSIAFLKDGQLDATRTYGLVQQGREEPITPATMFSVGSISKMVNAILTLRLINNGQLQLDQNVNVYMQDWQIEENGYTKNNPVTLRRILSHTAGLTVHGFADYLPEEQLPSTPQILNGTGPSKSPKVYVDIPVGSRFRYSGGGTTVVQQMIEEQTELSYPQAAKKLLFDPLGLHRTSYENPLPVAMGNIAKAHDRSGRPEALPRGYQSMPEMAASGLWTTPSDLMQIMSMLIATAEPSDNNFIAPGLIADMISPEQNSEFGLGPKIEYRGDEVVVFHSGSNDSYKAHFKIFWKDKSGYAVFTNGRNGNDLLNALKPTLDRFILED